MEHKVSWSPRNIILKPGVPEQHQASYMQYILLWRNMWKGELTGGPGGPGKPGRPEVQEQAGAKVGQVSSSL